MGLLLEGSCTLLVLGVNLFKYFFNVCVYVDMHHMCVEVREQLVLSFYCLGLGIPLRLVALAASAFA